MECHEYFNNSWHQEDEEAEGKNEVHFEDKIDVEFHYLKDISSDNNTTQVLVNESKECECEDCDYCIVAKRNGKDQTYTFIKGKTAVEIAETKDFFSSFELSGFKVIKKETNNIIKKETNNYIISKCEEGEDKIITNSIYGLNCYKQSSDEKHIKVYDLGYRDFKQMINDITEDYQKRQNEKFKGMNNQEVAPQNGSKLNIQ